MRIPRRTSVHPDQLVLDLVDAPQQPNGWISGSRARKFRTTSQGDGVFLALLADPATASRVAQLTWKLRNRFGLQGQSRPVLHVSLIRIGTYETLSPRVLTAVMQAASTVAAARFDVTFDRVLSFRAGDNHPLVLCCGEGAAALMAFHTVLDTTIRDAGMRFGKRSGFKPHMTLLYDRKSVPETILDEPITLAVRDFFLVRSFNGEGRYKPLGHWRLRA